MTIAAKLPKSNLDIRGDRLRYQLANALNECEAQYRRGGTDKTTNTIALLNAVIAKLTPMTTVGSLAVANLTADNVITAAEAASPVTAAVTSVNFANGTVLTVLLDGAVVAGVTVSAISSNAATITLTAAAATALSIGAHTLTLSGVDSAGVNRTVVKGFSRSA